MNELNYASLKASKRLVDNGIVLKTDAIWCQYLCGYRLIMRTELHPLTEVIPAPSMAEVWRELPEQHDNEDIRMHKDNGETWCDYGEYADRWNSKNPTDALIDLLIWVKGAKK